MLRAALATRAPRKLPRCVTFATSRDARGTRTETDSFGDIAVPSSALWGASTQRAVDNFSASGWKMPRRVLCALAQVKAAAARANEDLGVLEPRLAAAIVAAAEQVASGTLDEHFPVDVLQTGSGTSTNMNMNEVIANLANEALGAPQHGTRSPVHPNDHVNRGQSSNDVFPTATHVAVATALCDALLPALHTLDASLRNAAARTWQALKPGRTHLQDALPLRLGQVLTGHADEVADASRRIRRVLLEDACELAIGGTAVGTGFGAQRGFAAAVVRDLQRQTGLPLRETTSHYKAQASLVNLLHVSACITTAAAGLARCADALRWLGCGPRCGIGELALPALQPGSSIMPGKVNPVLAEALLQACAHTVGNHTALTHAASTCAAFELHTAWPLAAHTLVTGADVLARATEAFAHRSVDGLQATDVGPAAARRSLMCVTGLLPLIGYDRAAAVAHAAAAQGRSIAEVAADLCSDVDAAALARALDPAALLGPDDSPTPPPTACRDA